MNTGVLHHWFKRRHARKKREYTIKIIDTIIYGVAVLGIVATIPQATKIWIGQEASGVSLLAWSGYLITAFFWLAYGIIHREKPVIFAYLLWIFLDALIVVGIIVHG